MMRSGIIASMPPYSIASTRKLWMSCSRTTAFAYHNHFQIDLEGNIVFLAMIMPKKFLGQICGSLEVTKILDNHLNSTSCDFKVSELQQDTFAARWGHLLRSSRSYLTDQTWLKNLDDAFGIFNSTGKKIVRIHSWRWRIVWLALRPQFALISSRHIFRSKDSHEIQTFTNDQTLLQEKNGGQNKGFG